MTSLTEKAKKIKLVIFDVDGILTDGSITYTDQGTEIKTFHVRDGFGIQLLNQIGICSALISGRNSPIVQSRAQELNIAYVYQGQSNGKLNAYLDLKQKLHRSDAEIAYIGDDLLDLPLIRRAGLGVTVPEAPKVIKEAADWITQKSGGWGAARELCEYLIQAQGQWEKLCQKYDI